jgi:hypothetical protein
MGKLSALGTELRTIAETWHGGSKTTSKTDDKNQIKNQFISSQVFHRTPGGHVREITAGEQLERENIDLFDLVAQELHRLHPATIHTIGKLNNQPTITLEQDPKS